MRPVADQPTVNGGDEIYALIESGSKILFDGPNNPSLYLQAISRESYGSIQPAIEPLCISVMKDDLATCRKVREPRLHLLEGVLEQVARVDEKYVDSRLNSTLRAPGVESSGEFNIIGFDEMPQW
jgi:hypothetical protein